jgi:hypothetical protein
MLVRATLLALSLAAAVPAAFADPAAVRRTWLERVAISAADRECNLFSDGERLALLSGLYQAEGELLRANQTPAELRRLAEEVSTHAASLGCVHPEVVSVAETVRNGYRAFVKTTYIEYPATHAIWGASRSPHDRWAVSQTDKAKLHRLWPAPRSKRSGRAAARHRHAGQWRRALIRTADHA